MDKHTDDDGQGVEENILDRTIREKGSSQDDSERGNQQDGNDGDLNDVQSEDDESNTNWPTAETARLIELWQARPHLYDYHHKWYYNKVKKHGAWALMAAELKRSRKCF